MLEGKETYNYLGILEVYSIKQVEIKEKKTLKNGILQKKEKTTRNQTISMKSH